MVLRYFIPWHIRLQVDQSLSNHVKLFRIFFGTVYSYVICGGYTFPTDNTWNIVFLLESKLLSTANDVNLIVNFKPASKIKSMTMGRELFNRSIIDSGPLYSMVMPGCTITLRCITIKLPFKIYSPSSPIRNAVIQNTLWLVFNSTVLVLKFLGKINKTFIVYYEIFCARVCV